MGIIESYCGCGGVYLDEDLDAYICKSKTHRNYTEYFSGRKWDYYTTSHKIYVRFCPKCGKNISRLMNKIRKIIKKIFYESN